MDLCARPDLVDKGPRRAWPRSTPAAPATRPRRLSTGASMPSADRRRWTSPSLRGTTDPAMAVEQPATRYRPGVLLLRRRGLPDPHRGRHRQLPRSAPRPGAGAVGSAARLADHPRCQDQLHGHGDPRRRSKRLCRLVAQCAAELFARGDVDVVVFGSHVGAKTYMAGDDPTPADLARVGEGVISTFEAYRSHGIPVMVTGDVPGTRPDDAPACVAASSSKVDPCSRPRATADLRTRSPTSQRHIPSRAATSRWPISCVTEPRVMPSWAAWWCTPTPTTSTTAFSRSLAPYLGPDVQQLIDQPLR